MIVDLAGALIGVVGLLTNGFAIATGHIWNVASLMVCVLMTGYFVTSIRER